MPLLFGDFALDLERRQLLRAGTPVPLEGKVYELLTLLVARRPRVLSKAQIRDVLWPGIAVGDTSLPRVVAELRQALGDDARQPRFIRTAHGFGYAFCGEVSDAGPETTGASTREPESPYPGLRPFTEGDAGRFFGREAEVGALWEALRRRKLSAVIGASGAGKTSFVRAGVATSRPEHWAAIVSTPGTSPLRALGQALGPELASDAEALRKLVVFEDADHAFELVSRWRYAHPEALLVIDAFEELFTLNPPEVQARFAALLGRLVAEARLTVLLSLRDDFLMRCSEHEALRPVFDELTPLGPPTREGLRRAITEPARRLGYGFEDEDLVDEMVEAVEGGRGALPLLAFAVSRLWDKRDRERKLLTRRACDEIGGVAGALAQHAEATMERVGPSDEGIVREVFRNLTTAQGTRGVLEAEELLSAFPERGRAEAVLAHLLNARLLTSYESNGGEAGPGRPRLEIVHESLLTAWPRLVRWQTQDADGGRLRDQLRQAARLWHERGRPEDLLWTGASLLDYRAWRARYAGGLSALEADFVGNMTALAGRRRRHRRIAVAAAFATSLAVATGALGLWRRSEHALGRAQAEVRNREAAQLLSLGRLRLEDQPSAALAYALASLERADTLAARRFAVEALWRGPTELIFGRPEGAASVAFSPDGRFVAYSNNRGTRLQPRDGSPGLLLAPDLPQPSVAFSRQGERLLLLSQSTGSLRALSVPGGRELAPSLDDRNAALPHHSIRATIGPDRHLFRLSSVPGAPRRDRTLGVLASETVRDMVLDPAGRFVSVAVTGEHSRHRLFDLQDPPDVEPLAVRGEDIWLMGRAFAPDGRWLAATHGSYGTLWALHGKRPRVLRGLRPPFLTGLAFSADSRFLVSGSYGGEVWLWPLSPEDGERRRLYDEPNAWLGIFPPAIDPGARFVIVSTQGAGKLRVIPLGGRPVRTIEVRPGVGRVALRRDGKVIAVASAGRGGLRSEIRLHDLDTGRERILDPEAAGESCAPGRPEAGRVYDVAFLRDGHLLTTGLNGLRVFDPATGMSARLRPCRPVANPSNHLEFLSLAPDGRTVLVARVGDDPQQPPDLAVFDLETRTERVIFSHGGTVGAATLDPSGRFVVTGSADGVVRVGPLKDDTDPHLLYGHGQSVTAVAVSPDGRWIASAGEDGTIRLWPMPEGPPLHALPYETLLAKLRALTNLRVVADPAAAGGYKIDTSPFPGWASFPEW